MAPLPVLLRPIHHYLHAKQNFTITASTRARPRNKENGCEEGCRSDWLWTRHRPQLRGALVIEGLFRRAGEPHGVEARDGHHADPELRRVSVRHHGQCCSHDYNEIYLRAARTGRHVIVQRGQWGLEKIRRDNCRAVRHGYENKRLRATHVRPMLHAGDGRKGRRQHHRHRCYRFLARHAVRDCEEII